MDSNIWIAHCKKTNALHSNVKHHLSHWQSVAIFHKFHSGWHYANRVCHHLINFESKKTKLSVSMISSISEAHWTVDDLMGKLFRLGRGRKPVAWPGCDVWWAGDERIWLPAPPRPRSVLILLWFTPSPDILQAQAPLCPLSVKAAEIQVKAVRPARGQPPLQHHAPCLLVNCSENWICLLALNCLEETLCREQNWMLDRFLRLITLIIICHHLWAPPRNFGKHFNLTFPTLIL